MDTALLDKLARLPDASGVYVMRGDGGAALYVGKAKNIRQRFRSYLSGTDARPFVARLDALLRDVEVVVTNTDKEAVLLENDLIKRYRPRFNVRLVDDKNFLWLRLDGQHDTPRLEWARKVRGDGARYFGPYHSAGAVRQTQRLINRYFQLRTCSDDVLRSRTRPCLQYQIKRCPAPCVYDIKTRYAEHVANVSAFLDGRYVELVDLLRTRMQAYSTGLQFELAAQVRDQIAAIERTMERQSVVAAVGIDRDAIGCHRAGPTLEIHVMRVRGGRLRDGHAYTLSELEQPLEEILTDFLVHYYGDGAGRESPPKEILVPLATDWDESLASVLSERFARAVRVVAPQRGERRRVLQLAQRNARHAYEHHAQRQALAHAGLAELERRLGLGRLPATMECVDISHLQGRQTVGSVVRFAGGLPCKARYRHYRMKVAGGGDDMAAIYEIVSRRAQRGVDEADLPDLLVIDGGLGQLQAAQAALADHGVSEVALASLAKARVESNFAASELHRSEERVFRPERKNPIVLRPNTAAFMVLTHLRDEAHRFALRLHRKLRHKASTRSALDGIAGIGPARRRKLLRHFGSLANVRAASEVDLAAIIGAPLAARLRVALVGPEATK